MTKKDYIRIREQLIRLDRLAEDNSERRGIRRTAVSLSIDFARDNPHFDESRFLDWMENPGYSQ